MLEIVLHFIFTIHPANCRPKHDFPPCSLRFFLGLVLGLIAKPAYEIHLETTVEQVHGLTAHKPRQISDFINLQIPPQYGHKDRYL